MKYSIYTRVTKKAFLTNLGFNVLPTTHSNEIVEIESNPKEFLKKYVKEYLKDKEINIESENYLDVDVSDRYKACLIYSYNNSEDIEFTGDIQISLIPFVEQYPLVFDYKLRFDKNRQSEQIICDNEQELMDAYNKYLKLKEELKKENNIKIMDMNCEFDIRERQHEIILGLSKDKDLNNRIFRFQFNVYTSKQFTEMSL